MIDIFEEYVPICSAVRKCGSIEGRKRFHKLFYLAKAAGFPIKEIFEWDNYGPFSRVLANEIDSLCKLNLLKEEFNGTEYTYTLTDEGNAFLNEILQKESSEFDDFSQFISELNKFTTYDLEKMASIKFLEEEKYQTNYIINFLQHTKDYSKREIKKGQESMESLFNTLPHHN